jgi:arylsulfatase A-like enzyme/HEAT repeat protein
VNLKGGVASALVDLAAVVGAWMAALVAENAAIGFLWRAQFLGPWEISLARHAAAPLALAGLGPAAFVASGVWSLALAAARGERRPACVLGALGALAAGPLALGVSEGRHFASWMLRAPFVGVMVLSGAFAGAWALPRMALLVESPVVLGFAGLALAAGGWLADSYVLPRLYPAFHTALLVLSLGGAALAALAGRAGARPPGRILVAAATVVLAVPVVCAFAAPSAARALDRDANLRIVLVEHAPIAGRAVAAAMALRPPPEDASPAVAAPAPVEVARALDWERHDILLLTVDALRADHVSAYGYGRPTTPNIDALAREGTRFDAAYCPTPHTSYSLTSMMTGKYLRPLLALGQGQDSETWAQDLRRYGWRTAAFYPPAVFFIDQERFTRFEDEHLGFEYAKVEFAGPELREIQVRAYLETAPTDRPLFLWVHFFEPHEPYVVHAGHVFSGGISGGSSPDVDAYDSEVAEADDGIGRVVRLMRQRRADPVVIVTADHGEEFGEHGGRYHGTTVYEEQVRVPLVVVGPGVRSDARSPSVAQTIDLLPTTLSALGIPRPARIRGRDLGPALAAAPSASGAEGFALAETDDYELLAKGPDRLVCERRAAACALYRPGTDAAERRDFAADAVPRYDALRSELRATMRDQGRYEVTAEARWPEALRRGMQGDVEAALDVASLLDDADVAIRRKAAEVSYALHAPAAVPEMRRALTGDEDETVRNFAALALARTGEPIAPVALGLLRSPDTGWRRRAALALADRGDARGCDELASWWNDVTAATQSGGADGEPPRLTVDLREARELLDAAATARCRAAEPSIVRALDDVRVRPYAADALAALGDERARAPLLHFLATEAYVTTRTHEARALLALGDHDWSAPAPEAEVATTLAGPPGPVRIAVLLSDAAARLEVTANGDRPTAASEGEVRVLDFAAPPAPTGGRVRLQAQASAGGLLAIWRLPGPDLIDPRGSRK